MKELTIFVFGFTSGFALIAFVRNQYASNLERSLKAVKVSQAYYRGIVEQYESHYELDRGIAEVGARVDAAAKELGIL